MSHEGTDVLCCHFVSPSFPNIPMHGGIIMLLYSFYYSWSLVPLLKKEKLSLYVCGFYLQEACSKASPWHGPWLGLSWIVIVMTPRGYVHLHPSHIVYKTGEGSKQKHKPCANNLSSHDPRWGDLKRC